VLLSSVRYLLLLSKGIADVTLAVRLFECGFFCFI